MDVKQMVLSRRDCGHRRLCAYLTLRRSLKKEISTLFVVVVVIVIVMVLTSF